ncbi:MAG TPA: DUF4258 domain-containing protein [Chitinophaga sp.]
MKHEALSAKHLACLFLFVTCLFTAAGCEQTGAPRGDAGLKKRLNPASTDGLNRHAHLVYTHHARCRMDCRHITESEIEQILEYGEVNRKKSNPNDRPCPTVALEGYTHEGQHLRVVFAPCGRDTRVVTCIDLDAEWSCACN